MSVIKASYWSKGKDELWSEIMVSISHDNLLSPLPQPTLAIRHNNVNPQQVNCEGVRGVIKKTSLNIVNTARLYELLQINLVVYQ